MTFLLLIFTVQKKFHFRFCIRINLSKIFENFPLKITDKVRSLQSYEILKNQNISEEDKVYYENPAKSVNEQKQKDPKRKSKREIKYMENDSTRQSTFCKREESLTLMVRLFVKNQVKLKIKKLKREQLLYRNAQLNFNDLILRVVSYLEDSDEDSVLTLCSRSKKTKCSS